MQKSLFLLTLAAISLVFVACEKKDDHNKATVEATKEATPAATDAHAAAPAATDAHAAAPAANATAPAAAPAK